MDNSPIRVLVIPTTQLGYSGITNVILNYYQNIDRNKVQFDFVISCGVTDWVRKKITSLGGEIYNFPSRNRKPILYNRMLKKFILEHQYKIVHVHGNSATMFIDIHAAKSANASVRIAHTHSSSCKYKFLHKLLKPFLNKNLTHAFACSDIAGDHVFSKKYIVLNNGINLEEFKFNQKIRDDYREKMSLDNCFVIGHVGNMTYAKNHEFLIDVFKNIYQLNRNARLLLVGDGEQRVNIENKIEKLSLSGVVTILGKRNDVNNILQSMDVFVLPSRFEGLGIVNIEAQTTGLKCFVSDTVPLSAKATNNIEFLSLDVSPKVWARKILKYQSGYKRKDMFYEVGAAGFNISTEAKKLEKFYEGIYNNIEKEI